MKSSVFEQRFIEPETKSSPGYTRGNVDLQHEFSIREGDNTPSILRLLRIDIWDKNHLRKFSIIHLGTGEDITGKHYIRKQ